MKRILPIFLALVLNTGLAFPQSADDAAADSAGLSASEDGASSSAEDFDDSGSSKAGKASSKKASAKKSSSAKPAKAEKAAEKKAEKKSDKKADKRAESKKPAKADDDEFDDADVLASLGEDEDEMSAFDEDAAPDAQAAALTDADAATGAAAATGTAAAPAPEEAYPFQDGPPQISMLRTLGGVGLVLCLLGIAYFGLRKLAPGLFPKASGGNNLRLVETLNLGDKRSVSLIEVGGCRFLLGSTPGEISMLATLPEHVSLVAEDGPAATAPGPGKEAEREREKAVVGGGFHNLFEMEKKRPSSTQYTGNMPPEDIRVKMRRLREALEQ